MDLKQFIDQNREAFDSDEPHPLLLKKIQDQLPGNKKKAGWFPWRWAAMLAGILVVCTAFYFYFAKNKKTAADPIANQPVTETEILSDIGDPVYAKEIYHFRELIGLKQNELKQLEKEYPDLYRQFMGDINQLDSSYQSLKINLAKNPNREMLLEAMIQNLQLQSDLLNRQLLIIKEIKQKSKNQSHEKSAI